MLQVTFQQTFLLYYLHGALLLLKYFSTYVPACCEDDQCRTLFASWYSTFFIASINIEPLVVI